MTKRVIMAAASAFAICTSASAAETAIEHLRNVPAGSAVEIRLRDKRKIRGRLGEVGGADFELLVAVRNSTEKTRFPLADVKSVRHIRKAGVGGAGGWIALGAAAGVGFYALLVWVASGA